VNIATFPSRFHYTSNTTGVVFETDPSIASTGFESPNQREASRENSYPEDVCLTKKESSYAEYDKFELTKAWTAFGGIETGVA